MKEQRCRVLFLPAVWLISILNGEREIGGLPADAKIVAVYYDPMRIGFDLLVESMEYDVVPEGALPPSCDKDDLPYLVAVRVPEEQFGYAAMLLREGTWKMESPSGRIKFREFI